MAQYILEQNADSISNATFDQNGSDLVITGNDGQISVIDGYFTQNDTPDIMTPDGARLSPDMIDAFLSPLHAGEYASNNTSTNDVSAVGQITDIIGDATVTRADGTKISLESGMPIFEGDIIETGANGAVNILFADQTSFAVSEDARLSVDEFVYDSADQSGSTFFSMLKGAFVYTSGLIGKEDPNSVNIETPAGSIGIRGTVVMGKIDPTGQNTEITIIDGAVVVTNAGGTVELNDNFETVKLTSYEAPPIYAGQMTGEQIQIHYQSLSDVTGKNYGEMGQRQDSQEQDNTQQDKESVTAKEATDGEGAENLNNSDEAPADASSATHNDNQPTEDAAIEAEANENDAENESDAETEQTAEAEAQVLQPISPSVSDDANNDTFGDNNGSDGLTTNSSNDGGTESGNTGTSPAPIIDNDNAPVSSPFQFTAFSENFDIANGIREFLEPGTVIGHVNTNQTGVTFAIQAGTGDGNSHIGGTTNDASGFTSIFSVLSNGDITVNDTFGISNFANPTGFDIGIDATNSSGETIQSTVHINIEDMAVGGQAVIGTVTMDAALMDGTAGNDIIFGASGNDTLISSSGGNDVLIGGLGDDTLLHAGPLGSNIMIGGDGDDEIRSINQAHTDTISGGAGNDSVLVDASSYLSFLEIDGGDAHDKLLLGGGSAQTFNLTNSANYNKIDNIEEIFLNGTGADPGWTVQLDAAAVISMTDGNNTLKIQGNSSGATFDTTGSDLIRDVGADVAGFDAYTSGGATLLIENNGDVAVI